MFPGKRVFFAAALAVSLLVTGSVTANAYALDITKPSPTAAPKPAQSPTPTPAPKSKSTPTPSPKLTPTPTPKLTPTPTSTLKSSPLPTPSPTPQPKTGPAKLRPHTKLAKKSVADVGAAIDWELYSPDDPTTTSIVAGAKTAAKKALNQLAKRHGAKGLNLGVTATLNTDRQPILQQEQAGGDVEVTYFLSNASASFDGTIQPSAYSTISLVMAPTGTTFTPVGYSVTLVDVSSDASEVTAYEYLSSESDGEQSTVDESQVPRFAYDRWNSGCPQDLAVESAVNSASGSFAPGTDGLIAQATDAVFDGFGENACALKPATDSGGEISLLSGSPDDTFAVGDQVHFSVTVQNTGGEDANGLVLSDIFPAGLTNVTWSCGVRGGAACPAGADRTAPIAQLALPDVPVGGAVDFSIVGTVSSASSDGLTNTASVAGVPGPFACVGTGNECTSSTTLKAVTIPGEVFVGMKPVDQAPAVGAPDSFDVEVRNVGTVAVRGLTLTDPTPDDWNPTAIISWSCAVTHGPATCPAGSGYGSLSGMTIPALPVGGSLDFIVSGRVALSAANTVTDVATVSVPQSVFCEDETGYDRTVTDPATKHRSCSVGSTVPVSPAIELQASVVTPNHESYMELTVVNDGAGLDASVSMTSVDTRGVQEIHVGPVAAVDGATYTIIEVDGSGNYTVTASCSDMNNVDPNDAAANDVSITPPTLQYGAWTSTVTVDPTGDNVAAIDCVFNNDDPNADVNDNFGTGRLWTRPPSEPARSIFR